MKRVDRYVLREMLVPFLIGTIAVVLMFQANTLIALLKTFSLSAIPPLALANLILYKTPFYLNMTLPVGVALASSLAMSRITRESELTAMRSCGASILRVMRPVAFFGLVVGVGNYYLGEEVMPKSEKRASRLMTQVAITGSAPDFKSNVIVHLRNYTASFGTVVRGPKNTVDFTDVLLIERPRVGETWVYTGKTGKYDRGNWTFGDLYLRIFVDEDLIQVKPDQDVVIDESFNLQDLFMPPQPAEQTLEELRAAIKSLRQQGRDVTELQVKYHTRYSMPASCIVFALVGPVFAIWLGRSGGFVGVLLSILLVFLYYNLFVISTEIFGKNGWLDPVTSAWLPNAAFLVLGLFGLRRLE